MSDTKPNVQEDKDVEIVSDSPGHTREPLQSHTFCLKNNAAGPSSEEHENPLNGTQPNPFVYSSVPAVPHAGNSLPSGALVNGPGSHPTSEVHCVLNKGAVLSNNVLDAAWQVEKDTSPEVLPPPSELQSDAWKNAAGPAVKTLATQPGVNTPLSHSEENESILARSAPSGDGAVQMRISEPRTKQTIEAGSRHSAERSQSPSAGNGDGEVIRWDSTSEGSSRGGRMQESKVTHEREKLRNTNAKSVSQSPEKVNNSLNHSGRRPRSGSDAGLADKDNSLDTPSDVKFSIVPKKLDSERPISREDCDAENDPEDAFGQIAEQLKAGQVEHPPFFFSCTICNVNFKEKRHFHRHMMYHLGEHNQVNSENVSQAFVCRECGRLFCDRNSLMRHIIIHQDRLEKLLEEIQGLRNLEFEGSGGAARCPHCVFACNCPKIFVQHARAGDNLKHYYFCEECNYITLTRQALELHLHVAHLNTNPPQFRKVTNEAKEAEHVQVRGFFASEEKGDLKSHTMPDDPAQAGVCKSDSSTDGKEDASRHKAADENIDGAESTLSPSLWSINKHGKLLLQPAGKLDAATDLTCVEEDTAQHDQRAFGSAKQANCPETADFLLSARKLKLDKMFREGSGNDLGSRSLASEQENRNPPSMGRMLTPRRNSIDKMNGSILPRLSQRHNKHLAVRELERGCEGGHNFSDDTGKATGSSLESSENERNPYARKYFKKRQRFSAKDQSPRILEDEGEGDEDCSDIEQLIIKEEYIETAACENSSASPRTPETGCADVFSSQAAQHKACPYCPAIFESGVGLSNHVRGHLHRVGLSYNARHMVSPEQVALRDHQPPTRKRIPTRAKKVRKAVKAETRGEHTCPLCGSCFDTKTGLSNHVRGHLKRMGQSVSSSSSKSPLCILTHLLRDKEEHHNIFRELYNSQIPPEPSASPKFVGGRGPVSAHPSLPVEIKYEIKSSHATGGGFVPKREAGGFSERKKLQAKAQIDIKASSRTLVELLRARRESLELRAGNEVACAARKLCGTAKDFKEETSVEPSWTHGECDSDDSGIAGHLQAFTCRKRIHVSKEAGDDYEQKKPRPGLKKRMLPPLNAQIYTLTCRFCDLVFQGPLSVQEDWIKHLQRHLQHTAVPCSGIGMVEVFGGWPQNIHKHEHRDFV